MRILKTFPPLIFYCSKNILKQKFFLKNLWIYSDSLAFFSFLVVDFSHNSFCIFYSLRVQIRALTCFCKMHKNKEVSFEWQHHRILSTCLKVSTTLYSIINSTTGKYYALELKTVGFHPQTQSKNHLVQHNNQYHRKVPLSSFHLNSHLRISSTNSRVRITLCNIINSTTEKYCSNLAFILMVKLKVSSTESANSGTTLYNVGKKILEKFVQ